MKKMSRGKALLGCVPTAVVLMLAVIMPSMGVASATPALALVSEPEASVAEAEAAAQAAQADAESQAAEATATTEAASSAGEGETDSTADTVSEDEIVDNAPTFDDEVLDRSGNVVEDEVTADEDDTKIMPLGDSITVGVEGLGTGGYRGYLEDKLAGIDFDYVGPRVEGGSGIDDKDHAGFRGNTIEDIERRVVNERLITAYDPDIVLLMIGTNDIDGEGGPIGEAPERLTSLIAEIEGRAPSATILVSSIPPQDNSTKNDLTDTYNEAIPGVVDDSPGDVRYVNAGGRLDLDDLDDGKHPNGQGYAKIADAWAPAILGQAPPPSTTTTTLPGVTTTTRPTTTTTRPAGECSDGKAPNPKTGKCSDGTEPGRTTTTTRPTTTTTRPTTTTTRPTTTTSRPTTTTTAPSGTCADGKAPNPKSGKCPGGILEPSFVDVSASEPFRCDDGKAPNAKIGKCT